MFFFVWDINKKHNTVVSTQWYQQEISAAEGWTFKKKSPYLKKLEPNWTSSKFNLGFSNPLCPARSFAALGTVVLLQILIVIAATTTGNAP